MGYKVGDKVVWKDYPDHGVGTVLGEGDFSCFLNIKFNKYDYKGVENDCHMVYIGNLKPYKNPMDIVNEYHETKTPKTPFNEQVGGGHYKTMTIQPVEFILANELGFCEGNIIKYTCRYKQKGGVQDLKKVIHYAEMLIADLEEKVIEF